MSDTAIAIVLAVAAGFAYALASVLQQRAAHEQRPELSLRPGLLFQLFRNKTWLLGGAVDLSAFGFETAALGFGAIVVVQPLLVSGLLWALPLAAIGRSERVTRREWIPAILLVVALAVFVVVGSPEGGSTDASLAGWLITASVLAMMVVVAVAFARRATPGRRALLLAFSAGCVYGLTAALTKSSLGVLEDGVLALLTHWQLYVLLAVAAVGLLLNQSAFQAGHLAASLPAMAVTDPVIGCVIGVALFGEELAVGDPAGVAAVVASICVMVGATISLATSPLVAHEEAPGPAAAPS
jgi:drug/metabolite transporter (DMT)-like permease